MAVSCQGVERLQLFLCFWLLVPSFVSCIFAVVVAAAAVQADLSPHRETACQEAEKGQALVRVEFILDSLGYLDRVLLK